MGTAVRMQVPQDFLPKIAEGTFELGDGDEPTNSYSFGERAEFFQITFSGKCLCQSGYVGIKMTNAVQASCTEAEWVKLKGRIDEELIQFPDEESGLLFAGPVVQASSMSVYRFVEAGKVSGLVLNADVEEVD